MKRGHLGFPGERERGGGREEGREEKNNGGRGKGKEEGRGGCEKAIIVMPACEGGHHQYSLTGPCFTLGITVKSGQKSKSYTREGRGIFKHSNPSN